MVAGGLRTIPMQSHQCKNAEWEGRTMHDNTSHTFPCVDVSLHVPGLLSSKTTLATCLQLHEGTQQSWMTAKWLGTRKGPAEAPYTARTFAVCNSRMVSVVVAEGAPDAPVSVSCYLTPLYNIIYKRTLKTSSPGVIYPCYRVY
eukprot:1137663-Pelagomonas_calceolata.AAC.10